MALLRHDEPGEAARDSGWQSPILSLRREVNRAFDWFMQPRWSHDDSPGPAATWLPPMDLTEVDGETCIRIEIPGIKEGDVEVRVSGQTLTVSGEKRESTAETDEDRLHCERRFGRFKRHVELPDSADLNRIGATQGDGVLMIRIPKKSDAAAKRIEVKPAKRKTERVKAGSD